MCWCSLCMHYEIWGWGSQQDMLPLAQHSAQRQRDKMCMFALQNSLYLSSSHHETSVLSRWTAITCRPLDLGLQFSEQTHEHRDKGWVFDFSLDTSAKGNLIVLFLYIEKFKAVLFEQLLKWLCFMLPMLINDKPTKCYPDSAGHLSFTQHVSIFQPISPFLFQFTLSSHEHHFQAQQCLFNNATMLMNPLYAIPST